MGAEWSILWLLSSLKMEMSPLGSLRRFTWAVSGCGRGELVSSGPLTVSDTLTREVTKPRLSGNGM